jgi:hypothetical protein
MPSSRFTRLGAVRSGSFRHRPYYLAVAARRERATSTAPRSELQRCFERVMQVTDDPVLREALREIAASTLIGRLGDSASHAR